MKTILTLMVATVLGSCFPSQRPVPPAIGSPTQSEPEQGVSPMTYAQMLPHISRLSKEAGIPNLKNANLSVAQTELRLWMGLGLITPRCFILKTDNGKPSASFVSSKISGNRAVFHKGKLVYLNKALNGPHSGWPNFLAYLKQNGIESSIELAPEKRYEPYPDAEVLILEMKTGSRHTLAHYIDSTVAKDGKKAFAVCEKVQNEFDINLGCKL